MNYKKVVAKNVCTLGIPNYGLILLQCSLFNGYSYPWKNMIVKGWKKIVSWTLWVNKSLKTEICGASITYHIAVM